MPNRRRRQLHLAYRRTERPAIPGRTVEQEEGRLVLVGEDGRRLEPVDEIIALTGPRPDLSFLDELRLGLDERLQAPVAPAPLIDPTTAPSPSPPPSPDSPAPHLPGPSAAARPSSPPWQPPCELHRT